ncbi:probable calcium-binding protein CML45 [Lycium barbarum]|uniref:probable calcium-binding protein CML45 n=1 Tax=Lycium barbarum TaxID=112863 RepID=UPI00293F1892|nr:probable calcium-binding protein CML45 [Lycium barbarum]
MDNIFSISAISPSLMGKKIADDLNQFFCIFLRCTILSILSTFQDLYSCFSFPFRAILLFFITVRNALNRGKHDSNANADAKNSSNTSKSYVHDQNRDKEELLKEDVDVVLMDKLMSFCNPNGDKIKDKTELAEVSGLFEEVEPSFGEIKEAFDVFDENGDGYIDASELMKLIWRMGFTEFSVDDCNKMIMAFDENRDGRIEFREFLKLMEQSFRDPEES